ncbi:efflux RND transporter periplasmic adaptor subunit [Orrella marina]|uniref:Efflux transporter periplasmic adaptor subunit n=1 Tax=Orrella marina TaxID=2163011 RepID=A0A2R4XGE9_9BURK|nr:efflux RND transporter periplasmic adaptor subunit [Orrella marina]AWB32900.1 efflux transporter periplasmic adaptor subunit [Orrella marina]
MTMYWRSSASHIAIEPTGEMMAERTCVPPDDKATCAAAKATGAVACGQSVSGQGYGTQVRRQFQRWFVAGCAILGGLSLAACEKQETPPRPVAHVTWATPVQQQVQGYATFDATAAAMNTVSLEARVPGFLTEILYKDGTQVSKGDLLFVIEQDQYKEQVALNQAIYDEAKIEFDRQTTLLAQKATSQAAVDRARSELQQAQASLALANINLGYTEVRAPFDGVVSRHLIDVGNYLGSSQQGIKLADIRQIKPVYLYFSMNEMEVLNFQRRNQGGTKAADLVGKLPVYAQLQGQSGYPYVGVLDYAASNLDVQTGALQLRAVFENADNAIVPGLYANVLINYGQSRDALLVPYDAVQRDQQGTYVLLLDADNKVERKDVTIGQRYDSLVEVTKGLAATDKVVINGFVTLSVGQTVEPQEGKLEPAKLPGHG